MRSPLCMPVWLLGLWVLSVSVLGLSVLATNLTALAAVIAIHDDSPDAVFIGLSVTASLNAKTISSVPAYDSIQGGGCGPTAVASVLGYWDLSGFDRLFDADGSDLFLTSNVADEISSPEHRAKYDPLPDAPGPIPPFTSIADWFETSVGRLRKGSSDVDYAEDAFEGYASYRGYEFDAHNRRFSARLADESIRWEDVVQEIDANRPLMFLVDIDGNGTTDHFVPVVGYDDLGPSGRLYGFYNTWSENETIVWKPFQYRGNPWGVAWATFVRPIPEPRSIVLLGSGLAALAAVRWKWMEMVKNS